MDSAAAPTILLIDDYDSVRIAMCMILKRQGFNVLAAESPAAAREIWREHRTAIDLMVVDISMASISGPDLVTELRTGREMPVIFITGLGQEQAKQATRNIADPIVLQKPFSPTTLIGAIQEALHLHAGR